MESDKAVAVTFDFGQTLADLDVGMLSARLGERGLTISKEALAAAVPHAWTAYNQSIHKGLGGHPWKILMARLLEVAEAPASALGGAVDWLWDEQPRRNLWRYPVPGMIELVVELRQKGVPVGVVSNSEGKLAELIEELGWSSHFLMVADSGKLRMEKPGRAIFEWGASALDVPLSGIVHIGDSLAADVEGALAAGMRAIWFRGDASKPKNERVAVCQDDKDVRAALLAWGIQL